MITIVRRSKKRVSVFQWILATALFTVSCTTDVWNETEDDANAICFQAPQTESRAAVEGSSLPAKSSFLVWGGYDNNVTNVFDGETVSEFDGYRERRIVSMGFILNWRMFQQLLWMMKVFFQF